MDLPYSLALPDGVQHLSPWDTTSIGACLGTMGTPTANQAWSAANLAIFVPIRVSRPVKLAKAWWYNGSTVTHNIDIGIYSVDGVRLWALGSTAQGSASVIVSTNATYQFGPGLFYLAMNCDSASATFWAATSLNPSMQRALGLAQLAVGAAALPTTWSGYAARNYAFLPVFGVTVRSFV